MRAIVGLARFDPDFDHVVALEPDPGRPVHVAAQHQAPRGAGIHLRQCAAISTVAGSRVRSRSPRPSRPIGSPRRSTTSITRSTALYRRRPPNQVELDNARRALVEGQARHFETPVGAGQPLCATWSIHGSARRSRGRVRRSAGRHRRRFAAGPGRRADPSRCRWSRSSSPTPTWS